MIVYFFECATKRNKRKGLRKLTIVKIPSLTKNGLQ